MDKLTLILVVILIVLVHLIYKHHENLENVSGSSCPLPKISDYNAVDVESAYFNQLERNKTWNERQSWLNNKQLEARRQSTHTCLLE